MNEYTLDEQIAALRKLGEIREVNDTFGFFLRGYPKEEHPIVYAHNSSRECIQAAHEFLRTDPNAWMAMDEAMAKCGKMTILARGNRNQSDYQYNVQGVCAIEAATRQAAVYSVFMQFIREELKK